MVGSPEFQDRAHTIREEMQRLRPPYVPPRSSEQLAREVEQDEIKSKIAAFSGLTHEISSAAVNVVPTDRKVQVLRKRRFSKQYVPWLEGWLLESRYTKATENGMTEWGHPDNFGTDERTTEVVLGTHGDLYLYGYNSPCTGEQVLSEAVPWLMQPPTDKRDAKTLLEATDAYIERNSNLLAWFVAKHETLLA